MYLWVKSTKYIFLSLLSFRHQVTMTVTLSTDAQAELGGGNEAEQVIPGQAGPMDVNESELEILKAFSEIEAFESEDEVEDSGTGKNIF